MASRFSNSFEEQLAQELDFPQTEVVDYVLFHHQGEYLVRLPFPGNRRCDSLPAGETKDPIGTGITAGIALAAACRNYRDIECATRPDQPVGDETDFSSEFKSSRVLS